MTKKKKTKIIRTIVLSLLVLTVVAGAIVIPTLYGSFRNFWYELHGGLVDYPVVLVHGLGGWGEKDGEEIAEYWGATSGSIPQYLREEGYSVCVPSVGPYSSTWDRACELYAQLCGTTVDYGAAHAAAHHHERFGRKYTTALVPNWGNLENGGQRVRINLIGHSFGGATVRLLASLMANGNAEELAASGKETSALFTGGKKDWIFSVTTLCAPHNGSQLTCMVNEIGSLVGVDDATEYAVDLVFKALKQTGESDVLSDLMLEQFGIGPVSDTADGVSDAVKALESAGNDHAFYDLSPDGAAEINKQIDTVESIYYFSYAYSTTKPGQLLNGMVPQTGTLPVLYPLALAMGSYTGTTPGGIVIDESWHDNDGLVSVVSAQYPTVEDHADLPDTIRAMHTGVWYVAPTLTGDHGTPVGLNASLINMRKLYDEILERSESLR